MQATLHKRSRWIWRLFGIVAVIALSLPLLFTTSPVPGAMVIRFLFDRGTAAMQEKLEKHRVTGVTAILNQQYRPGDADAYLDVYFPDASNNTDTLLPTIIWTHGGGWLSGQKDDAAIYLQILASKGYTVIALEYSLAPGKTYPTQIEQINAALAYIEANRATFHADTDRIVLAGDSAGAQLTSQMAAIITNPVYANELAITPALEPRQLRGVVLHCGFYDTKLFIERGQGSTNTFLKWGTGVMVWAYTGSRDVSPELVAQLSPINYVTSSYPPAFISGGNADPLTDVHSRPFAQKLESLGVSVTTLFFPPDHQPALGHEYQFDLDTADGQKALNETLDFVKKHTT